MGHDELEWVRDVIDHWLTTNATTVGLAFALACAVASVVLTN